MIIIFCVKLFIKTLLLWCFIFTFSYNVCDYHPFCTFLVQDSQVLNSLERLHLP